jgi:hypothetical protein
VLEVFFISLPKNVESIMKNVLFSMLLLCILLCSCGKSNSQYNKLLTEKENLEKNNAKLVDSLSMLTKELNSYRFSPSKLHANAETLFEEDNLNALDDILAKLQQYHPESKELGEVKVMRERLFTTHLKKQAEEEKQRLLAVSRLQKKQEEKKKQRMSIVSKLRKKHDDVSNITWYYNPYFTHYNNTNRTSIYIGKKDNEIWLRLKMSYNGDNWIFFEEAYLSYDGNTREISFDKYENKESDNGSGGVWEWIDVPVDNGLLSYLKDMVKGKTIKMRLSGKYTKTRNLSPAEVNGIKDILLAYDVLIKGE